MKRPWHILVLFGLFVALVGSAMGWLTWQALELNRKELETRRALEQAQLGTLEAYRETELARQKALFAQQQVQLEGRISSALWRMDTILVPLLSQEIAQPFYYYRPFYAVTEGKGKGGKTVKGSESSAAREVASPLLVQSSDHVLLHFELDPDGRLSSPQAPTEEMIASAVRGGVPESSIPLDNVVLSRRRLDRLEREFDYRQLATRLPDQLFVSEGFAQVGGNSSNFMWNNRLNMFLPNTAPSVINNNNDIAAGQQSFQTAPRQQDSPYPNSTQAIAPRGGTDGDRSLPPPPTAPPRTDQSGNAAPRMSVQTPRQQLQSSFGSNATEEDSRDDERGQHAAPPTLGQSQALAAGPPIGQQQAEISQVPENTQVDSGGDSVDMSEFDAGLWRRNRAVQFYAQNAVSQQRRLSAMEDVPQLGIAREGACQALWIGDDLILARRVSIGGDEAVQGCWLDWPMLKGQLLTEVRDLLPQADLEPIRGDQVVAPNRRLATLPVRLVTHEPSYESRPVTLPDQSGATPAFLSSITVSLWIAWGCLLLTTVAVGALLLGVLALSERRASFVSAVTHELRTPLTTFRMYAEMLAEGMIPNEQRRGEYLETLRIESDRLSHLVENVLQYARLERGRGGSRREPITVKALIDRVESRLNDRARQAEMKFTTSLPDELAVATVRTDPAAVEQILFNLVDNACKYAGAAEDRRILLDVRSSDHRLEIRVRDHGPGISAEEARRLFRPFSKSAAQAARSAPGVGLGLALCRRLSRALGGRLELEQVPGPGASFLLTLPK